MQTHLHFQHTTLVAFLLNLSFPLSSALSFSEEGVAFGDVVCALCTCAKVTILQVSKMSKYTPPLQNTTHKKKLERGGYGWAV